MPLPTDFCTSLLPISFFLPVSCPSGLISLFVFHLYSVFVFLYSLAYFSYLYPAPHPVSVVSLILVSLSSPTKELSPSLVLAPGRTFSSSMLPGYNKGHNKHRKQPCTFSLSYRGCSAHPCAECVNMSGILRDFKLLKSKKYLFTNLNFSKLIIWPKMDKLHT